MARAAQSQVSLYILLVAQPACRRRPPKRLRHAADALVFKPLDPMEWLAHMQMAHRINVLTLELIDHVEQVRLASQQLEAVEREKYGFYRDVLSAVTGDKLHFVEPGEIPDLGVRTFEVRVTGGAQLPGLRRDLRHRAGAAGMDSDAIEPLLLASGEALTNALHHGVDAGWEIWEHSQRVTVRVTDRGTGIAPMLLPASILRPGFSTRMSMGAGFEMMLQFADDMWLATGPSGTTVQLSNRMAPGPQPDTEIQLIGCPLVQPTLGSTLQVGSPSPTNPHSAL